jgi:hypothetical protein
MTAIDTARSYHPAYARLSVPCAIAGLALLAAMFHVVTPFNHDEAYFIAGAAQLLDGGRFGKDVIDINPPHIYWMSTAPIWLARPIGARSDIVATFFTGVMAAASLIACERLIASGGSHRPSPRGLVLVAAGIVLFAPGYDFGQREHWMLLLTMPYIIARSRRAEDIALFGTAASLIGVAACFGFCMKPYYLLVPIAIEVWLLARTRRPAILFSPETIALGITGLLYLAAVLLILPGYFQNAMPTALLGYWAFNGTLEEVLRNAVLLTAPAVVLGWLGYTSLRQGEAIPALAQAFAAAGVAFLIAALLQLKPWPYHFLPSIVSLYLAAAVLLMGGTARLDAHVLRLGALSVLIVAACLRPAQEALQSFENGGTIARVEKLAAVFRANPGPSGTVAGFLTSPRDVFPAVLASGMNWALPFGGDYLIPAAVRADEAPAVKRPRIEAAAIALAERDVAAIRAKEPGVIVIDAAVDKLGFGNRKFDYLPWLESRTDFTDLLRQYREIDPVGPFRLFVRK